MKSQPQSVQELITYFNENLFPHFEKEEIKGYTFLTFEKLLHFSRMDLRQNYGMMLNEDVVRKFISVVDELLTNKPIQYILGETEFYGLKFLVDENVLIPRQETEELVDWILTECKLESTKYKDSDEISILDIGTGSGCIPISLKKNLPEATVRAIDISEEALKIAARNALLNEVEIHLFHQNILDPIDANSVERVGLKYHIIVSNPPYIRQSECNGMQKNVVDYEPHLALFVDDKNPLLFYTAIAIFAKQFLKENGKLYFEINESFGKEVREMLSDKGFTDVELRKDLNGKDRMIRAISK